MTTAKELFQQGELNAAIQQVISEVKARPTDTSARTFLFELLCFAGELDRAEKQLDVIATQSVQAEAGVMAYRNCLKAERERRRLWTDGVQPHFLSEPPAYVDLHLDAINCVRAGKLTEARALLDKAESARPAFPGTCDGVTYYDWRDADDFVAPVLEAIVKDQYVWIPYEQIRSIQIGKPEQLRDLLYTPARIETTQDTHGQFFLMSLYAGSSEDANDQNRLGRMTDWRAYNDELARGVGARMLMIGDEDKVIYEVESIEFDLRAENAGNK
ncbi:MAG: avirulence locus temperature-dependent protein secretion protein [Acidobacteria bacterium]|nr:avirulence locus temperature-dependent protein secretion protein [Acidobacteriota bacterium]